MQEQVVQLLNDKIDKVDERVSRIEDKVDQLLAFKWQIIGGSVIMSLIVTFFIQLLLGGANA
jgi:tetrahydromethanopterin S-methyltransferase subunit G